MARIRSIKPEIWHSADFCSLSRDARLLWIALWNFADDKGRGDARPAQVKIQVFPVDADITERTITALLWELHSGDVGFQLYDVGGKPYYVIPEKSWRHQKIDHPQPPKFPDPSTTVPGIFVEYSSSVQGMAQASESKEEKVNSSNVPGMVGDHFALIGGIGGIGKEGSDLTRASVGKKDTSEPEEKPHRTKPVDGMAPIGDVVAELLGTANNVIVQTRTTPRPGISDSKAEKMYRREASEYKRRYEKARNLPWMAHAQYRSELIQIGAWIAEVEKREDCADINVREKLWENFFTDEWAKSAEYPLRHLAKNPGKYFRPPEPAQDRDKYTDRGRSELDRQAETNRRIEREQTREYEQRIEKARKEGVPCPIELRKVIGI